MASNYESGMGSGRSDGAAPEDGMGATQGYGDANAAPEEGLGSGRSFDPQAAPESGMGGGQALDVGPGAVADKAPESGMGANEGGAAAYGGEGDSKTDYGLGSGRANDQKEGEVGKLFDKVKGKLGGHKDKK